MRMVFIINAVGVLGALALLSGTAAAQEPAPSESPAPTPILLGAPTPTPTPAAAAPAVATSTPTQTPALEQVPIGGYGEITFTQTHGPAGAGELDLRRFVLFVGHRFDERTAFYSEIEISHSSLETEVEQAFVEFTPHKALGFRVGSILVPMGIVNQFHEPPTFLGVDRPETDDVIIPTTWREAGAGAFGEPIDGVRYQVQVVDGLDASKFAGATGLREGRQEAVQAKANDFAVAARVEGSPVLGVVLGVSGYGGSAGQDQPGLAHVGLTMMEGDLRANWRGVWLRGEFAHGEIQGVRDLDGTLADPIGRVVEGWYAEAGYDVLRPVRMRVPSLTAELIPFVRYERTDTQLGMPVGFAPNGAYDRTLRTLGVTLKPIPRVALKADYQWLDSAAGRLPQQWHLGIGYMF